MDQRKRPCRGLMDRLSCSAKKRFTRSKGIQNIFLPVALNVPPRSLAVNKAASTTWPFQLIRLCGCVGVWLVWSCDPTGATMSLHEQQHGGPFTHAAQENTRGTHPSIHPSYHQLIQPSISLFIHPASICSSIHPSIHHPWIIHQ